MLKKYHIEALRKTAEKAEGLTWALTGSTSFALQGMEVEVHDIDIQTDRESAYRLGEQLEEYCTEPVHFWGTERMRSHFGRFRMGEVEIEVMGDIEKRVPGGEWEAAPDLREITKYVAAEGMILPVLSLEYDAQAYRTMGRIERAKEIERYIEGEKGT